MNDPQPEHLRLAPSYKAGSISSKLIGVRSEAYEKWKFIPWKVSF